MNDDERLSALFDGKVVGREREELLAHLAASDDDYEVFADTAEVLQALEEEDALAAAAPASAPGTLSQAGTGEPEGALADASGVLPFRRPERARPRVVPRWLTMAAGIAGVALVSTFALRGRGGAGPEPMQLAQRLEGGLPDDWTDEQPWVGARGNGTAAERNSQSVQAGVMLMQLAVAMESPDVQQTRTLARQISERFGSGTDAAAPLDQIATGAPQESFRELVEEAADGLKRAHEPAWLDLGISAEAVRLAAANHETAFFRGGEADAMLRNAERLTRGDEAARAAFERVRDGVAQVRAASQPPDWNALSESLKTLLREIAS